MSSNACNLEGPHICKMHQNTSPIVRNSEPDTSSPALHSGRRQAMGQTYWLLFDILFNISLPYFTVRVKHLRNIPRAGNPRVKDSFPSFYKKRTQSRVQIAPKSKNPVGMPLKTCTAEQPPALFQHLNFQKTVRISMLCNLCTF